MKAYYEDEFVTLFHADCMKAAYLWVHASLSDVLVSDPPYGIDYRSGRSRVSIARSIQGDKSPVLRDEALKAWQLGDANRPAILFGSWKIARPANTHTRLIWDTKGALGMGDLSVPWKPSDQEIYVIGKGFTGPRTTNVLSCAPVQSTAKNGRVHPNEKPVALMAELIRKCPPGTIADPFAGSGSTLVAAKAEGRRAIGIEIDERYCEIAANRLAQNVLDFPTPATPDPSFPQHLIDAEEIR